MHKTAWCNVNTHTLDTRRRMLTLHDHTCTFAHELRVQMDKEGRVRRQHNLWDCRRTQTSVRAFARLLVLVVREQVCAFGVLTTQTF